MVSWHASYEWSICHISVHLKAHILFNRRVLLVTLVYIPNSNEYYLYIVLTSLLLHCLLLFFIHLKLELLTRFPASNDEKYFYL